MADDFNLSESLSEEKFIARGKMYQRNLKLTLDSEQKPSKTLNFQLKLGNWKFISLGKELKTGGPNNIRIK